MGRQDPAAVVADPCTAGDSDDHGQPRAAEWVVPVGHVVRPWAIGALVAAYGGDTHRLLTDLAGALGASVAYVDRLTVEAHLERPLSDGEWSVVAAQFTAMAFDEHVGDAGTLRTDWIEDRLHRAGLPGRTPHDTPRSGPSRQPRRR
jgi:hypothetical protein